MSSINLESSTGKLGRLILNESCKPGYRTDRLRKSEVHTTKGDVFVDQRRLVLSLFLFFSLNTFADEVSLEPPTIVEATPIDTFSERAEGWTHTDRKNQSDHQEQLELYDGLLRIPGITGAQESPRLSIRGSSSLARVLGLYDGVPLNLADGFGFNNLLVPHEAAGSMKIIKGPASIFWGKDALGGAINLIPKKFEHTLARVHVGSFGQRGGFAAIPIFSPTERSSLQVTAYGDKTDGNFPYQSTTSGLSGTRAPNDRATQRFTLNGEHTVGSVKIKKNLIWAQEFSTTPGSIYSPFTTHFNRTVGLASLSAETKMIDGWKGAYRLSGLLNQNVYESSFPSDSKATRISNSVSVTRLFPQGFSTEIFVDHFHDELKGSFVQNNNHLANETEGGAIAAFSFQPDWTIRPGFRYVEAHKKWIPALGLFEQNEGFSRWLTYSHGFRAPSLSQKYSSSTDYVGNPNLKPESSEQIELGFQQKVTPDPAKPWTTYEYGVSVFSTQYSDFLDNVSTSVPFQYTTVNRGDAESNGVEGNAAYKNDSWGVRGEVAYLKTEDNNKRPLIMSPEIQTLVGTHCRWAFLIFELEHTLWTKYYDLGSTGTIERTGWNTLDFHLRTDALQSWQFKFSIYNIADSPREIAYGYPESQRRLWVSVERSF